MRSPWVTYLMDDGEWKLTQENNQKNGIVWAYFGWAVLLLLGGIVFPFCWLFLPIMFIIPAVRFDIGKVLILILLLFLAGIFILGFEIAAMMLIFLFITVIPVYYMIKNKRTFYSGVFVSGLSMFVCVLLGVLAVRLISGMSLVQWIMNSFETAVYMDGGRYTALYSLVLGQDVSIWLRELQNTLPRVLLISSTFIVALFGLLNYLIPHNALKKRGVEVNRIPQFAMFSLPRSLGYATGAGVLLVIIGQQAMKLPAFDFVAPVVYTFCFVVYYIQGIAFLEWLLKQRIQAVALRVLIYVGVTLLLPIAIVFVGVFEQIARIRRRENQV